MSGRMTMQCSACDPSARGTDYTPFEVEGRCEGSHEGVPGADWLPSRAAGTCPARPRACARRPQTAWLSQIRQRPSLIRRSGYRAPWVRMKSYYPSSVERVRATSRSGSVSQCDLTQRLTQHTTSRLTGRPSVATRTLELRWDLMKNGEVGDFFMGPCVLSEPGDHEPQWYWGSPRDLWHP